MLNIIDVGLNKYLILRLLRTADTMKIVEFHEPFLRRAHCPDVPNWIRARDLRIIKPDR